MSMIWSIAQSLVIGLSCVVISRRLMHYFQLESYQFPGYWKSVRRSGERAWLPGLAVAAAGFTPCALGWPRVTSITLCAMMAVLIMLFVGKEKAKKPFVITERVKRLMAMHALVCIVCALAVSCVNQRLAFLLPVLAPALVALSGHCAEPIEKNINQQFVNDAKQRLEKMPGLIKIGITGSYGKTSTKFLLRDILSVKYNVLATPSSFNTTMGVTRVIREQLTGNHQVFIAEMGARHVGDIAELVDLVHPTIGMITSVGPQHLDTFGTIERVRDTKYELIAGLPQDGKAIFARDGAICEALYARCPLAAKYMPGDLITAGEMSCGPWGTRFILTDTQTGESAACETKLLGEHSIANLLLCCTTARLLGMSLAEIARGVALCQPVEHRLQLLPGAGGITIIDDAFNSNPVGSAAALRVLAGFPGRRIVVTPGMVELGEREAELNRAFGRTMAECVDIAILVGRRHTQPIAEGLREAGFPEERIFVTGNLDESTKVLHGMMKTGDVVLYENDLPDNYSE